MSALVNMVERLGAAVASPIAAWRRGYSIGASVSSTGQWEGHERNRIRYRPPVQLTAQDESLDYGTRERMISEARSLCQVFPLALRILHKYSNYCVGDCRYKWSTGDAAVDVAFRDYWYGWMDRGDANGVHRFPQLARLAVCGMLRDGDIFATYVPAGDGRDVQVRLIEADRVGNYRGSSLNYDDPAQRIVGGVLQDAAGRPRAYRVNKRTGYGQFKFDQDLPAGQVRHLFDPDRADATRGVTAFRAVLNHLRDQKETIDAEKAAIKNHSKISLLSRLVTGGMKSGFGGINLNTNADSSANSAQANVQEVNDAMNLITLPGEDIKAFHSERPGNGWDQFQQFLVQLISIGMDLPAGVIWKMLGTGPAVRYEINDADRTFRAVQDVLEEKLLDPTVAVVISNGIARGLIPEHPNWHKFERQRPASITIDMGRESAAGINENEAWLRSGSDWYAEDGKDYDEETKRIATERAKRWLAAQEAAAATGAPVEYILAGLKQPAPAAEDTEDDDEPPAKSKP